MSEYAIHAPVYQGGFANGKISFKKQCMPLVKQLLVIYPERPMRDDHYQIIEQRVTACNESYP